MNQTREIVLSGLRTELLEKDNRIAALEAERDALDNALHDERNAHQKTAAALHMKRLWAAAWRGQARRMRQQRNASIRVLDAVFDAPFPFSAETTSDHTPACLDALDSLGEWDDSAKAHTLVSAYTAK